MFSWENFWMLNAFYLKPVEQSPRRRLSNGLRRREIEQIRSMNIAELESVHFAHTRFYVHNMTSQILGMGAKNSGFVLLLIFSDFFRSFSVTLIFFHLIGLLIFAGCHMSALPAIDVATILSLMKQLWCPFDASFLSIPFLFLTIHMSWTSLHYKKK